jgi:hypothetical protein
MTFDLEKINKLVEVSGRMGPLGTRRISRGLAISGGASLILFFAAHLALDQLTLSQPLRLGIALMPVPAFAWFVFEFVASVRRADELERQIQLEALAVAFPLTMVLVMTLGHLQVALPLAPEDWSYRHTWPLMYVFYLVGLTRARKRYL